MITISLIMIVKNEEEEIINSLKSIRDIVDEIIIVSIGNKEITKELAMSYGASFFAVDFENDFSKVKNYAFRKANKEYILWLNPGEIIDEKNRINLKSLKKHGDCREEGFFMKVLLENSNYKEATKYITELRLVKNKEDIKWRGKVYEVLDGAFSSIINSKVEILSEEKHYNNNSILKIIENLTFEERESLNQRELFYYGEALEANNKNKEALLIYKKILKEFSFFKSYRVMAALKIAEYCLKKERFLEFKNYLFLSYELGEASSKANYLMGEYLIKIGKIKEAKYWYKQAITIKDEEVVGMIIDNSFKSWLSLIRLCEIDLNSGNYVELMKYNFLLKKYLKDSPIIKYNERYLNKIDFYLGENI